MDLGVLEHVIDWGRYHALVYFVFIAMFKLDHRGDSEIIVDMGFHVVVAYVVVWLLVGSLPVGLVGELDIETDMELY